MKPGDLPLDRQVRLLTGADFWALNDEPAIGLRRMVTSDGPAGVRGELWDERDPSVNVPSPTALAASWDLDRVHAIGRLLAADARRKGVDVLLGPTVNIQRSPVGGRHFECFSEDPVLTSRLAVAYVRGVQSGGVAATIKHVVANDFETSRLTVDVRLDERSLRELYLLPFEAAVVEADVWAAMAAYNSVRGTTMTENPLLELLRDWGFDGVVMSDWGAARSLAAATAELDLVMPGPTTPFGPALVDAVTEGRVPAATVTEKVRRIVELGEKVGAAGPDATPGVPYGTFAPPPVDLAAITAQLRETAAAGFVLLRNEQDVLPLAAGTRVALIGEHAVHPRILGGGSAFVFPTGVSTPAAALRDALGDAVEIVAGVAVSERIGAPELSALGVPGTDRSGVAVRFLGEGDQLLGSDERASSTYNWNNAFAAGVDPQDVRTVEVHTTYTAATSGPHVFGCSGVGRHAVRLDGQTVVDTELALPPGADGVEGLTRPPQAGHSVHLVAGQQLDWVVRRTVAPEPGRLTIVALQINVTPAGPSDDEALLAAEAAARAADVAVVVVGTTEEAEGEGFDRALTTEGLSLPGRQDELVRRVAAVNPRTVVVVDAGAPVLLPWRDDVAAVLATWFPGQEFGAALADVLTGAVEPGGRLPVTWLDTAADPLPSTHSEDGVMQYTEGLHIGHRRYLREGAEPAYWFGHGLGYTTWAHEDPLVTADAVTVGLRNTGSRPGRDVVQVYLARPDSALDRPVRWLAGFGGATVGAGERTDVRVELPWRAFAHWDEQAGDWAVEPGEFTVLVGGDAGSARVIGSITPGSGPVPTS